MQLLAFDRHTVSYAIFGLSMTFIGFLLLGYIVLMRAKTSYLSIGSVGKVYEVFKRTNECINPVKELPDKAEMLDNEPNVTL